MFNLFKYDTFYFQFHGIFCLYSFHISSLKYKLQSITPLSHLFFLSVGGMRGCSTCYPLLVPTRREDKLSNKLCQVTHSRRRTQQIQNCKYLYKEKNGRPSCGKQKPLGNGKDNKLFLIIVVNC